MTHFCQEDPLHSLNTRGRHRLMTSKVILIISVIAYTIAKGIVIWCCGAEEIPLSENKKKHFHKKLFGANGIPIEIVL